MRRKIDANKPKIKIPFGRNYIQTKEIVHKHQLHTICESGHCPNLAECWGNKTATLMILGNICTRSCKYCSVPTGKPLPPDAEEAEKIAESINLMQLKLQSVLLKSQYFSKADVRQKFTDRKDNQGHESQADNYF